MEDIALMKITLSLNEKSIPSTECFPLFERVFPIEFMPGPIENEAMGPFTIAFTSKSPAERSMLTYSLTILRQVVMITMAPS
mmetsp:Transcript_9580/g.14352  ORF Transcript_9580/g.14352 Transcript_9580/m.14352 type:complete len:82 (-) Transcript_9580:1348-1593(-)